MRIRGRGLDPHSSIRGEAERRVAETEQARLENLTQDEVQALIHELEVHKIELELQNQELREAQQTAADSNERYRRLYDSAPIGFMTLDFDGQILETNQAVSRILDVPHSRLVGSNLSAFVAAHCQDRWHMARRDLQGAGVRLDLTLDFVSRGGGTIDVQVVGTSTGARDQDPNAIQLALIDVTALRRTERALQAAVVAATMAEERERRKLASDLHDDAGQLLSLASLKLHMLDDGGEAERGTRMADLEGLLSEIRSRVSSLSFQLSPPLLHDVGLIAAIHWLAESLASSHGLHVKIVEETEFELDENSRVTLYRAIRELLLNVIKHSGVKEARIQFSRDGSMACVAVEDTGGGMPSSGKRTGFGLLALRERIEGLGGSLETRGTPGRGTTVVVRLPIPNQEGPER